MKGDFTLPLTHPSVCVLIIVSHNLSAGRWILLLIMFLIQNKYVIKNTLLEVTIL